MQVPDRRMVPLLALLLSACGNGASPPEDAVFDPLTEALDRAETVEDLNRQRMEQLQQRLQDDGG